MIASAPIDLPRPGKNCKNRCKMAQRRWQSGVRGSTDKQMSEREKSAQPPDSPLDCRAWPKRKVDDRSHAAGDLVADASLLLSTSMARCNCGSNGEESADAVGSSAPLVCDESIAHW